MHSDILPKRYCDELMKLRSDVKPMPFSEVSEVLDESYGCPWGAIFLEISEKHLFLSLFSHFLQTIDLVRGLSHLWRVGHKDYAAVLLVGK